jgi:hypothetical protein
MDTQYKHIKKQLHAAQYRIYAIAILITAALSEFVWTVYNVLHRNTELYFTPVYAILLLMGAKLVYRRLKDTESIASVDRETLNDVYMSLSYKTSGVLLYPYIQPGITGRNNQLLELRNADGTLNTALFLLDSNAYTGEGINVYDYIHDDQVEWYTTQVERLNKEAGRTVPSMVFFHIPLQQYRTAYELYEAGSDEVRYYFGENGEKMINKVCCSNYPSALFDRMLALGSTTGVFCGHDHYNNMSLEYKGIRLTYGMSIDYLAMPGIEHDTAQRGAELITIHPDASWDLVQIPLISITGT